MENKKEKTILPEVNDESPRVEVEMSKGNVESFRVEVKISKGNVESPKGNFEVSKVDVTKDHAEGTSENNHEGCREGKEITDTSYF